MAHLTEVDFQDCFAGRLSPERLLALDTHVEGCVECAERLATNGRCRSAQLLAALVPNDCPEYESLAGYLDGTLAESECADVHRHLDHCDGCRAGLAEMRAVDGVLSEPRVNLVTGVSSLRPGHGRWAFSAGAAGLLVGLTAGLMFQQTRINALQQERGQLQARKEALTTEVGRIRAEGDRLRARLVRVPGLTLPSAVGGKHPVPPKEPMHVTIDPPRRVAIAKPLPPVVAEAIRSGLLVFPACLEELIAVPEVTRGAEEPVAHVRAISPAGTAVSSRQPLLIWEPLAEATNYQVMLLEGDTLTRSGPLTETHWRPPEPLQPGATYSWQVSADLPDGTRVTTSAPMPRFRVLDAAAFAHIEAYQRDYRDEPLVLGVLLVREGLLDDAVGELRQASAIGPNSATARKLLKQLQTRRGVSGNGS